MSDVWGQHGADEYAGVIADLLPTGPVWPRDQNSDLMKWVAGCALIWGSVDSRAADLLIRESDPRLTIELLTDWERAYGLPDDCVSESLTVDDRRQALLTRITTLGGQSRAFFISLAAALGYTITISEYRPYQTGMSMCGDTRPDGSLVLTYIHAGVGQAGVTPILSFVQSGLDDWVWRLGAPEIRYIWRVKIQDTRLSWFRAASGQAGVDPMLRIAIASDLECIIQRWKPAHTEVIFDYSGVNYTVNNGLDFSNPQNSSGLALIF